MRVPRITGVPPFTASSITMNLSRAERYRSVRSIASPISRPTSTSTAGASSILARLTAAGANRASFLNSLLVDTELEIEIGDEGRISDRVRGKKAPHYPPSSPDGPRAHGEDAFLDGLLDNALRRTGEFSDFARRQACCGLCHKLSLPRNYLGSTCRSLRGHRASSVQALYHSRCEAIAAPSTIARSFLNEMSGSSLP